MKRNLGRAANHAERPPFPSERHGRFLRRQVVERGEELGIAADSTRWRHAQIASRVAACLPVDERLASDASSNCS